MNIQDNRIVMTNNEFNEYKSKLINKCFAILGIYEDCEKYNVFTSYISYIDRIKFELVGLHKNMEYIQLISIINILTGMQEIDSINHKQVKSLVFHIISTIQKMEV